MKLLIFAFVTHFKLHTQVGLFLSLKIKIVIRKTDFCISRKIKNYPVLLLLVLLLLVLLLLVLLLNASARSTAMNSNLSNLVSCLSYMIISSEALL